MNHEEFKRAAQASAVVATVAAVAYVMLAKLPLLSWGALRGLPVAVTFVSFFWLAYVQWLWRWPLFSRLFDRPNLNGTWLGDLRTDWTAPDGSPVGPKKIALVVRQTLLSVHFTSFTRTFVATSYAESFCLEPKRGIRRVVYLYAQDSTIVGNENNREGACVLRIEERPAPTLRGRYWSNRKSNGEIVARRVSRRQADSFEEALSFESGV